MEFRVLQGVPAAEVRAFLAMARRAPVRSLEMNSAEHLHGAPRDEGALRASWRLHAFRDLAKRHPELTPCFRQAGPGKTRLMRKWRYALLGWFTWKLARRRIERKLRFGR